MGGFVISCVGVLLMIFPLRYLGAAEELRSNAPSPIGRYAAIGGPVMYGIFLPAFELSLILGAHSYLSGHARTGSAIDAATGGGAARRLPVDPDDRRHCCWRSVSSWSRCAR